MTESSEWVIQDLQHPGDVKLPHLTPPDDTPKSFTTRISGSKARFFDATGKLLGLFESPDFAQNNDAFFDSGLSIDPETGRIYTANFIKALCFEPIR